MTRQQLLAGFLSFGGIGKIKKGGGTVATLATLPLWWLLVKNVHAIWYMVIVFLFVIGCIYLCQIYEEQTKTHDSHFIVVDEVAGFLITMTWLPITWQSAVLGFVLFRFFDIVKPGPIGQIDAKVKGGVGVMIDDVAAGLFSNLILQILFSYTGILGSQIAIS